MSMYPPEPNVTPCPTFPATKLTAVRCEGVFAICRSLVEPSMVYQLTIPEGAGTQLCALATVAGTAIASATASEAPANRRPSGSSPNLPAESCAPTNRLPSPGRRHVEHARTTKALAPPPDNRDLLHSPSPGNETTRRWTVSEEQHRPTVCADVRRWTRLSASLDLLASWLISMHVSTLSG